MAKNSEDVPGIKLTPFQALKQFGQDTASKIYGGADQFLGGRLPGGPIQGQFNIPLQKYVEKRRMKGEVLNDLQLEVEHYIKNGLQPEAAVRLVIGNKKNMFQKTLDPNSEEYMTLASGDTNSLRAKEIENAIKAYKYFELASPDEMGEMFSKFGVTDGQMVNDSYIMKDVPPAFIKPSLANLPTYEWNKMGLIQNEAGEWVPGRTQPVGGYGAEKSRLNPANRGE